jgi:fructose-bisphosphate aldolase class II
MSKMEWLWNWTRDTGGEEDGVDNSDVDSSKLYTTWRVAYAYEELSKISPRFTIAAAFGIT